jgi:hypothetical protein
MTGFKSSTAIEVVFPNETWVKPFLGQESDCRRAGFRQSPLPQTMNINADSPSDVIPLPARGGAGVPARVSAMVR